MYRTILFVLLFCPAIASSAHITDRLLAGLYASANNQQQPIQLLPSGTPVELLANKGGFVKVQLVDGKTGWVEKRFLSEDTPAKVRLLALQGKYRQLKAQLDLAEERLADSTKAMPDSKVETKVASDQLAEPLPSAEAEITVLPKQRAEEGAGKENSTSYSIVLLAVLFLLCSGLSFFFGLRLQDQRQLKRHGGFRI